MSVSRKENGSLVKKAGRALVDLAFSLTSNKAIANRVVSEGMTLRNVTLYNGKLYQLNLDGTRGDEISMSRLLDYSNSVELNPTTRRAISYTTPSDGILIVSTRVIAGDDRTIYINNKPVFVLADLNIGYQGTIEGIPKGSVIKTIGQLYEDTTGQARHLKFVPYK